METKIVNDFHFVIQKRYVNEKLRRLNYASIKIRKSDQTEEFIIKLNHRKHGPMEMRMPKFVRNKLHLKIGDILEILEIREVRHPKKPSKLINKNHVDLLFLLPKKMSNGNNVIIDYNDDGYIRLWSLKCQEFKIKRFVEIDVIGKLLGLIQAESAKKGNKFDFTNIFYSLHKEFLMLLGSITDIENVDFKCYLQYNPRIGKEEALRKSVEFLELTNLPSYKLTLVKNSQTGDIPPVELCIFNKLFNDIFLGILNNLRFYLINKKLDNNEKKLAECFISKLLTGDGSIMVYRKKGYFTPHIDLFDKPQFLEYYRKILLRLGINSKIYEERFQLNFRCDWYDAIYLYKIGAFEGHDINRKKLLESIVNNSKAESIRKLEFFINKNLVFDEVKSLFARSESSGAEYWLNNRISEGYLRYINRKYLLTDEGEKILKFIKELDKVIK